MSSVSRRVEISGATSAGRMSINNPILIGTEMSASRSFKTALPNLINTTQICSRSKPGRTREACLEGETVE